MSTWRILCRTTVVCDDRNVYYEFMFIARRLVNELNARGTGYQFFFGVRRHRHLLDYAKLKDKESRDGH